MLSFFPRDVLDEIWDLIESVSEGFSTYSSLTDCNSNNQDIYVRCNLECKYTCITVLRSSIVCVTLTRTLKKCVKQGRS